LPLLILVSSLLVHLLQPSQTSHHRQHLAFHCIMPFLPALLASSI
jgi:hypothetical protein